MMSGLEIRQGTVYCENATGKRLLLIHHDPMNLRSLAIPGSADSFDCAHPAEIAIDDLIALRKSGAWTELGDVPAEVLRQIIQAVMESAPLDENSQKLLGSILPEE